MYSDYELFIIYQSCKTINEVTLASKLFGIMRRNNEKQNYELIQKLSLKRIKQLA